MTQHTSQIIALIVAAIAISGTVAGHGGATDQHHGESRVVEAPTQPICDFANPSWRNATTIDGVAIESSQRCQPDNPHTVAAAVKGTNNIDMQTLKKAGLSKDAVVKKNDRDGDGDPDDIYITLELVGINEQNRSSVEHEIAPGIKPAFWAFAPKTSGMVEEDSPAEQLIRMPSPSIRIEQGDRVFLEVENTHYMPHTVHLHGVDHPFEIETNNNTAGNDGVPAISEQPIPPGESRTYQFQPRQPGSMMYHCHVVPNVHVEMGLNGMFVVEEDRANNTLQTLNIGAGKVRHESKAVSNSSYEDEYDMVYQSIDKTIHQLPKQHNDTRKLSREIHREHDVTDAQSDYYLINGKSFPYSIRDSIVPVEENKEYQLNVLNVGPDTLSLHTHGHKVTKEAVDGVELDEPVQRDVISLTAAQRATLTLNTTNDGLNAYSDGMWIFHDHTEPGVTTDGIAPGGNLNMIAYKDYLNDKGLPNVMDSFKRFFSESYYQGKIPYFQQLDKGMFGEHPDSNATPPLPPDRQQSMNDSMTQMKMGMDGMMMDMTMKNGGMVVNENTNQLPPGCTAITGNRTVKVTGGSAEADPGDAYAYDRSTYRFDTCERVTVTFNNTDQVRHQWMLHGLPAETYPMGMFNIEAQGGEAVSGTFITPTNYTEIDLHCSVPQHEQQGMNGQVIVGSQQIEEPSKEPAGLLTQLVNGLSSLF